MEKEIAEMYSIWKCKYLYDLWHKYAEFLDRSHVILPLFPMFRSVDLARLWLSGSKWSWLWIKPAKQFDSLKYVGVKSNPSSGAISRRG